MNAVDLDYTGLRALFINCTLKRSPEPSHTEGLIGISAAIMGKHSIRSVWDAGCRNDFANPEYR